VQAIVLDPTPLARDELGTIRVAGTRVTLEGVASAFDAGATPEEIVQKFPVLPLAAVYAVCAYRLSHRAEVDAYLAAQAGAAEQARSDMEARFPAAGIRERLLARRLASG
jgi:uncharacterized protein (DUF433 family)